VAVEHRFIISLFARELAGGYCIPIEKLIAAARM
jgi:hypothetical protein